MDGSGFAKSGCAEKIQADAVALQRFLLIHVVFVHIILQRTFVSGFL